MPSLSIKNVPEETVARLRARAKMNHRSLQGEVMVILEGALEPRKLSVEEVGRRLRAMNFSTPDESTKIIRADRDAR